MPEKSEIHFKIQGTRLPGATFEGRSAVRVGIQTGREVVDDVPSDAAEVLFSGSLCITRLEDGALDFGGPFVFGTRGDRFLYLCWGERIGGAWDGFRRAKIKLGHVPPEVWEEAIQSGLPVVARLELTDAKGAPKCASLRPDEVQWSVAPSQPERRSL